VSQNSPLPIPRQEILGDAKVFALIVDQHLVSFMLRPILSGEVVQGSVQGIPRPKLGIRIPGFKFTPERTQRHFGNLGAGDGGKTFLEELARWRGIVVIRVQAEADSAKVRAARERESIAVGVLDWS